MRFSPAFLDEIRGRVPVSEVVGRRVRLKKQGREWAGLSPFNKEKTPSFFVNDQKGFYHCFSSGKHGDVFSFLMEVEGLPFSEAVERLADIAGLQLPRTGDPEPSHRGMRLRDVVEQAARYFQAELKGHGGQKARAYLAARGLSAETIARFRLGYAPPGRGPLRQHLGEVGVPVADMLEAGLLTTGEAGGEAYERFRDRVIFPIEDTQGRVVAFGGRTLDPNVSAKYLNSPETALFHKGGLLYNHHRARNAAHKAGTVLVVEGYVDAIALAQSGLDHVTAPLGTALTENQLELLWRLAPEPILCFDGDGAGRRAAWRAVDLALPKAAAGRSLRFAFLPDGQDPDDLVRGGGRPAVEAVLAAARPLSEVLLTREVESAPLDTPERRAELEQRLRRLLAGIADETVRRHYRALADERLAELFKPVAAPARFERRAGQPGRFVKAGPASASFSLRQSPLLGRREPPIPAREATLLVAALNHPKLVHRHCERFGALELSSPPLDQLRRLVLHACTDDDLDPGTLRDAAAVRGLGALLAGLEASVRARREWWAEAGAAEEDADTGFRHTLALHVKVHALHNDLRSAETALAQEPSEDHFRAFVEVQRSLRTAEGTEATIEGFGGASGRPVRAL